MDQSFSPGDFLLFQLESGFGLFRVLALDNEADKIIWHVGVYEELFPDVESAELALGQPLLLHWNKPHLALTERAFERTPAARLGNAPLTESELSSYLDWQQGEDRKVFDRSLLLLLGMR